MKKQISILAWHLHGNQVSVLRRDLRRAGSVVRQAVKRIFAEEIQNRKFTPVIASHNLRELDDICDHIGLLHKGGILLSKEIEDMKFHIHKIQCVFLDPVKEAAVQKELDIVRWEKRGSLLTLIARGTRQEILCALR